MKDLVSIICPTYNKIEFLKQMMKSIEKNTQWPFELIIVDNASNDGTQEYVLNAGFKMKGQYLRNEENKGFAIPNNQGVEVAKGNFLCFLNNDTIVTKGWLTAMMNVFSEEKACGIIGARLVHPGKGTIQHAGIIEHTSSKLPDHIYFKKPMDYSLAMIRKQYFAVTGACMVTPKTLYEELGGFDEQFWCGWEDMDYCYDKETQIMTKNGIKYLKDITLLDEVMTYNNDTNEIEYQNPIRTIKKKEKELLSFKNKRVDIQCSRDQKLLVGYFRKEKTRGLNFKEVDFIKAGDLEKKLWNRQSRYFIRTANGKWNGNNRIIEINGKSYNTDLFVKLLAWSLSEGCVNHSDKIKYNYGIKIYQNKKENYTEIVKLVSDLGFKPKCYKNVVVFYDKDLYSYLKLFGKSDKKYIPDNIKSLPIEYLNEFIRTYIKGDGSIKKNGNFSLFTSSERMRNDLIELLIKTNQSFTFHKNIGKETKFKNGIYKTKDCWVIQCCNQRKNNIAFLPKPKVIDYNDYIYDVEVPNHTIYIIRNGKGCWSSNCQRVRRKGYRIYYEPTSLIYHYESRTEGRYSKEGSNFSLYMQKYVLGENESS